MSAIISSCGRYRMRLERQVAMTGPLYAYFGINPSTADAHTDDATVTRWTNFTKLYGGRGFVVGNVFAYRSTDVAALASVPDPVGPENAAAIAQIIAEADILVPCWGRSVKVPAPLRPEIARMLELLRASGKPVKAFGLTQGGDPLHPLMLPNTTQLIDL